jgi:hypothetical protein
MKEDRLFFFRLGTLQLLLLALHFYLPLSRHFYIWVNTVGFLVAILGLLRTIKKYSKRKLQFIDLQGEFLLISFLSIILMAYWSLHLFGDGEMHVPPPY